MTYKKLIQKKAQAWGTDLMVALVIFTIGIVVFYLFSINQSGEAEEVINSLNYEGAIISDTILSGGYPYNWTQETAVSIGILYENKIDDAKLEEFYNFASTNYQKTKSLFNTKYDYYFFLDENFIINSAEVRGIGKPGATPENIPSQAENLIKITRFTVYKNKPVTAYLYIWEE